MARMHRPLAFAPLAVLLAVLGLALPSTAAADTTTFKIQFVCNDRGVTFPLTGVRVDFVRAATHNGEPWDFANQTFATTYTNDEGRASFTVSGPEHSFFFRLFLVSNQVTAAWFWDWNHSPDPVASTDTNQNDVPVQDYGTKVLRGEPYSDGSGESSPDCAAFEGLRRADQDVRHVRPVPTPGPRVLYLRWPSWTGHPVPGPHTIGWPNGYPSGRVPGTFGQLMFEFGKGVYNALVDYSPQTISEHGDYPCLRYAGSGYSHADGLRYAFIDGWGEYWAGAWAPAPKCSGVSANDYTAPGNVAAALAGIDRFCPDTDRRDMVNVLASNSGAIYSLDDFRKAIGCSGFADVVGFRRPSKGETLKQRHLLDQLQLHALAHKASALRGQLSEAKTRAGHAPCPPKPCTDSLERVVAPPLIRAQLGEVKLLHKLLKLTSTRKGLKSLGGPNAFLLNQALKKRTRSFRRHAAKIGAEQLDLALEAAQHILKRDQSKPTLFLASRLRAARKTFRHHRLPPGFTSAIAGTHLRSGPEWKPPPPPPGAKPDLVVDSITGFINSTDPALHVAVRNAGDANAPASKLLLHSRSNANDKDVDYVFDVPALAPGASVTIDASCDNIHAAYAADSATATADSSHVVTEGNESNNSRTGSGDLCRYT